MRQLFEISKVTLFVLVFSTVSAGAARDGFEINLSELRSATAQSGPKTGRPLPLPQQSYDNESGNVVPAAAKKRVRRHSTKPDGRSVVAGKITVVAASPCKMVREMAEKMNLLKASPAGIHGAEVVSAEYAGQGVTVACGLSMAEKYTLERLLSGSNSQLLTFESDEFDERVVARFANYLGLTVVKQEKESAAAKATYIFPPSAVWAEELLLTVVPDKSSPAKPVDKIRK